MQETAQDRPGVTAMCLSRNKNEPYLALLGAESGLIRLISTSLQYLEIQAMYDHELAVYSLDFSPANDAIRISCSEDNYVVLWKNQDVLLRLRIMEPFFVQFSTSGNNFLVVNVAGCVQIFDLQGALLYNYQSQPATSAAVNVERRLLVLGG